MKSLISSLFFLYSMALVSMAQGIVDQKITEIDVNIKGPKSVSESRIRNFMSVKKGQTFSYDKLDDDVKSLYESGLVDDVVFLADPQEDGVKIIAEVKTRPSLQAVDFQGNSTFSDKKIKEEVAIKAGTALNDSEILKGKRAIETLYTDNGYPDTSVSYHMEDGQNGFSILVFDINEGIKGEVDEIYFHGNDNYSRVELEREMETKEKGIFSFFTKSGVLNGARLEEDKQLLVKFYQNNGYLRARIDRIDRTQKDNGMLDLNIYLTEGAKYTVTGIGFNGNSVYTYDELWAACSLIGGDSFSAKKMEDDIRNIRSFYGAKGYSDVRVRPELKNTANNGVTINYSISEGSRYRVGRVNVAGNETTKDHVIRREVPMTPGEWFNSVDLDTTKNRLRNLNYFSVANATARKGSRAGYRDVDIQVAEKRTGSLGFGVGFSSIDSIVGFINLEQTNFDIRDPWGFKGGGQRFNSSLRAGAETLDFKVGLTEPWFLGQRLSLGGEVYYQDQRFLSDAYDQRNYGAAIFLRKPIGQRGFIKGEYRLENIEIDLENDLEPGSSFVNEEGEFWRSALTLSYVYDSRNSNINPRRGSKLDLSAAYTGGFIGGDNETFTISAAGTTHILLPYDIILNLSAEFTVVEGDDVPIYERTFLGGARNLRGFDFRDVGSVADGTRDEVTNEATGGNTSAFFSSELTFPLFGTVRGASFLDVGFVNEDSFDFSPGDLHANVGVGVRLNLPFGPFAIDYAIPIQDADQDDDGNRFQFYLDYQF